MAFNLTWWVGNGGDSNELSHQSHTIDYLGDLALSSLYALVSICSSTPPHGVSMVSGVGKHIGSAIPKEFSQNSLAMFLTWCKGSTFAYHVGHFDGLMGEA